MIENLNSKNTENDKFNLNTEYSDSDYKDLITRLQEIKLTIALLEKTIFK